MKWNYFFYILIFACIITLGIVFIPFENTQDEVPHDFEGRVLRILNWEDYLGGDTLEKEFEEKYNVEIEQTYYQDEDEALDIIRDNPGVYDLVVLSESLLVDFIDLNLLEKLNLKNIPNEKYIHKGFHRFEGYGEYLLPFLWGSTGIVVNEKYVDVKEDSWDYLFRVDPEKFLILNNKKEVSGMFIKYIGESIDQINIINIKQAVGYAFFDDRFIGRDRDEKFIVEALINESIWVAQLYSDSAYLAGLENPDLRYIIPEEGAALWIDGFAIPLNSSNVDISEVFLNYILDPKILASISEYQGLAPVSEKSKEFLSDDFLDNKEIFLESEDFKHLEFFVPNSRLSPEILETEDYLWDIIHESNKSR